MFVNAFDFTVDNPEGTQVKLDEYKGDVLLIVNTATECGFTPQYADLETWYKKFRDQGFEVLDFPCNQFGGQAPGTDQEISEFCVLKYGTEFPRFKKIDVNGPDAIPLYKWLEEQKGFEGFDPANKLTPVLEDLLSKNDPDWKKSPDIKWNFTKFVIDRNGNVVARFEPTADPKLVEECIEKTLKS